jgi:hypothetical protein
MMAAMFPFSGLLSALMSTMLTGSVFLKLVKVAGSFGGSCAVQLNPSAVCVVAKIVPDRWAIARLLSPPGHGLRALPSSLNQSKGQGILT